jgi:hypothetical protein
MLLNLLTLYAFLTEVDEFRILFRVLDGFEDPADCTRCFRDLAWSAVVHALLGHVIPVKVNHKLNRPENQTT